jgi:SAM-dependent methyltransferase
LPDIKPFLADLTYAIPALIKQKKIMAVQTASLIDGKRIYDGYLEVGSTGRYLDSLEEVLNIEGEIVFLTEKEATYSLVDMVDRGQVFKAGQDISLNEYKPDLLSHIPRNSLDLVTVYIGFHHCPVDLREDFISSVREVLRDDGVLILRDHDAHNEKMNKVVALAHDVFNMGTNETWDYNSSELRNFYSLNELELMLAKFGFKSKGDKLFQDGDPTLNALMRFSKA